VPPGAQDKEGYTPLHIAAGYLNRGVVRLLLAAGADPELQDKQGRSALDLIVSLKENTPNTAEFFTRRSALDEVAKARGVWSQRPARARLMLPLRVRAGA
jgi:signal recognition particle protein